MENTIGNPEIGLKVEAKVRTTPEINKLFLPGEMGVILDWEVRDTKTGELAIDPKTGLPVQGIKKSESFVRQFFDLLIVHFAGEYATGFRQIKDTSNVMRDICVDTLDFACNALTASVLSGIIVGGGVAAPTPTINDYVIASPIAHGVGAGNLQYGAVTFGLPASDTTTSQFTITRNFANGSGNPITVYAIALYVKGIDARANDYPGVGPVTYYFMTIYDGIGGGITVANGQTLTVNYRPQCVI
jgi:hypothetical protein